jgi:hypothetical protein
MIKTIRAKTRVLLGLALPLLMAGAITTFAGEADIVDVKARQNGSSWSFDVTVLHADAGWDHYADKWDIVSPDGEVLGTRVLAHPHDTEQPFTRSISGVEIPESVTKVTIRAHDSVHEYGGKEMTIELPR